MIDNVLNRLFLPLRFFLHGLAKKINCYAYFIVVFFGLFTCLANAITFIDVNEIRVEGNSLLTETDIQRAVAPYLGKTRLVSDVDKAAEVLQALYQDKGYPTVYVSVPPQDVVGGIVKLRVLEAKIHRTAVNGSKYFLPSKIKQQVSSVQPGQVIHLPSLQKQLGKVNRQNASLSVVPIVKPSKVPQKVNVELSVKDEVPFAANFNLNNYHTSQSTPTRFSGNFTYSNLWQKNHQLVAGFQISPEKFSEVKIFTAAYTMPYGEESGSIKFSFSKSNSQASVVDSGTIITGSGNIFGLRYNRPVVMGVGKFQSFTLGAEYKDLGESNPASRNFSTIPIDFVTLLGSYDIYNKADNKKDVASLSLEAGLRGGFNDENQFDTSRSQAVANFLTLSVNWLRNYQLKDDWQFEHNIKFQLSDSPIIANKQFFLGGQSSVRGYYESQAGGDYGYSGYLQFKSKPLLKTTEWLKNSRVYSFYDFGQVYRKVPLPGEDKRVSLSSLGFGFESKFFNNIDLLLTTAYALKDQDKVDAGDIRARANLSYELF